MTKQIENDYFGLCPICHKTDGYANAGKSHTFYCKEHKTSWCVGSNLFSSWRWQTLEEQSRRWDEIGLNEFEEVRPYFHPRDVKQNIVKRKERPEGLAARDDSECILLVKHKGKWFVYEGHQEINYAFGREQVPNRDILHDDVLPF